MAQVRFLRTHLGVSGPEVDLVRLDLNLGDLRGVRHLRPRAVGGADPLGHPYTPPQRLTQEILVPPKIMCQAKKITDPRTRKKNVPCHYNKNATATGKHLCPCAVGGADHPHPGGALRRPPGFFRGLNRKGQANPHPPTQGWEFPPPLFPTEQKFQ